MPGTILVVDDEKNIVQLARLYLNNEGFRVEAAHDGKQALEKAKALRPDLIVLDIMMPEMDGLTVCKELRKTSNVPVIILTARGDDIDRIVGLEIGADDYMAKPFNPRELVARVKAVLRRSQGERDAPEVVEAGGLRIDVASREVTLDGGSLQLRAKEFDLLTAFAQHKGNVLDRERLLRLVWGTDYYGDSRTIDVHVAWLRDKLGDSSVKIQTVWGVGYKLVVERCWGVSELGSSSRLRSSWRWRSSSPAPARCSCCATSSRDDARERYGRLAEPLTFGIAALAADGKQISPSSKTSSTSARVNTTRASSCSTQDQVVVYDTEQPTARRLCRAPTCSRSRGPKCTHR